LCDLKLTSTPEQQHESLVSNFVQLRFAARGHDDLGVSNEFSNAGGAFASGGNVYASE
jgi:hypothetical protein